MSFQMDVLVTNPLALGSQYGAYNPENAGTK